MNYYVSQHSFYDSDRQLWKTEIGTAIDGDLLYSCWGNTASRSRANAVALAALLRSASIDNQN